MQTTTTGQTYAIDPAHSQVGFSIRHLMISKIGGIFTGVSGTIELGGNGDIPVALTGTIDAASVNTLEEKRDAHLRAPDFLDVENFPAISFKSTAITGSAPAFTVVGDLTLHGVTKSITLAGTFGGYATDPWGNARVGYSVTGTIDRNDFGVSFNAPVATGGVMLGEKIQLTLDIEAVAAI